MRIDATNVNTPPPPVSVPDGGSKVSAAKVPAGDGGGADALGSPVRSDRPVTAG
jgi:hypothetical protein